ncbi:MAG: helix-hairpin-helix domain-containing protein [Acidobacteriota bacterium]
MPKPPGDPPPRPPGADASGPSGENLPIAARLEEVAALLEQQNANPFRVDAYRNAAQVLRRLGRPASEILQAEGLEGLDRLPGIGPVLARAIRTLVVTGRLPMLERLRGESDPAALLASVPGIGRTLAERIHRRLGVETLEDLEAAAFDGRLENIAGMGAKKLAGIRDSLSSRLGRVRRPASAEPRREPPVSELLDVDREYLFRAVAGEIPRIAPRRFNPKREAWLPILHTQRGPRHYTALFSNTARAHALGRTHDWVVLYADGDQGERQWTVVTASAGPLKGHRVVRGREAECLERIETEGRSAPDGKAAPAPRQSRTPEHGREVDRWTS